MSVSADLQTRSELYAEVQNFYARHIQLMDECRAEEAGQTFAANCSMLSPPKVTEPIRGRADITASLRRIADLLDAEGVRYRRCHTMLLVEPQTSGVVSVRCYVQVIKTLPGEEPRLHAMCVCEDVLVREDGELKVRDRVVIRDDLR